MLLPQEPTESSVVLGGSWFGSWFGSWMSGDPIAAMLAIGVVAILVGLLLNQDAQPGWHTNRVKRAARRAASRWAASKNKG